MWVNLQNIGKNVFKSKKWTNKNDTNEWSFRTDSPPFIRFIRRVNLPSSDSSWTLTLFRVLPMPILFPSSSYQAVSHVYWLEFKLRKYNSMSNGSLGFLGAQICIQSILWVGWQDRIFLHKIDKMTCYPSHFLSDL